MFIYFLEHSGQMVMMIVDLVDEVTVVWLKAAAFCAGKSTIGKNKKNRCKSHVTRCCDLVSAPASQEQPWEVPHLELFGQLGHGGYPLGAISVPPDCTLCRLLGAESRIWVWSNIKFGKKPRKNIGKINKIMEKTWEHDDQLSNLKVTHFTSHSCPNLN